MSTALIEAPEQLQRVDDIVKSCSLSALEGLPHFQQAFKMAEGVNALREAIDAEVMRPVMSLANTTLGFRCDKDNYPEKVVKDAVIEALMRGAHLVGNEFNIIAGNCYLTKQYFIRAIQEFPGVTDFKLSPSVPIEKNGGCLVDYKATWKLNGKDDSLERTIPVKKNSGMGLDAILGKAERKMRAAIYAQLTGSNSYPDGEVEEPDVPKASKVKVSTLNEQNGSNPPEGTIF